MLIRSPGMNAACAAKVLEMLSHVNKRLQGSTTLKLPLEQLVDLFLKPTSSPLTRNFALVYVETAFKRASAEERLAVVRFMASWLRPRVLHIILINRFNVRYHYNLLHAEHVVHPICKEMLTWRVLAMKHCPVNKSCTFGPMSSTYEQYV